MSGTSVPSIQFTATGFVAPSGPAVLAGVQADINVAFGGNLDFNLNTPQGQLASSEAALIVNSNSLFVYYTNQVNPAYASGRFQDAIGAIYFLKRDPSEPTVLQILCSGLPGVPIPVGATIQDTSLNLYQCTGAGTIGDGGSVTLSFACTVPGPVAVPNSDSVKIYQAIPNWDSATVVSGVIGSDVESRDAFEARRADSVAGNSFGAAGSVIGAVAKVPGVLDYYGYDNGASVAVVVGGVTIAKNSIYICVAGGAAADVAQAIFSKKAPGCGYNGNTTVVVYDSNPLYSAPIPYNVTFQIPSTLQVLYKVTIPNGPQVPSTATTQIQTALVSAFNNGFSGLSRARIGSTIYATTYVPAIAALGSWAQVAAILVGSANTADSDFVGHIRGTTLTVTATIDGLIAVGQTLGDQNGLIPVGTTITALGSGVGGTGTYTVSGSLTVSGATFTAAGTGLILTASAVTGSIGVGDYLTGGTGIPATTIVVSQISGTTGGAGTYQLNHAMHVPTTVAGTTNAPMSGSVADQTSVTVRIDQEPQLSASNISVVYV